MEDSNSTIAAALATNSISPMQAPQQPPMGPDGQFVGQPMGMGGPMRIQSMPQMRPMPYPPPQMRPGGPPQQPHFSPMGMQQQQQFGQGPPGQQMQQRPQPGPAGMPMGMAPQAPPPHMVQQQQQQQQQQFVQNPSPMPPPGAPPQMVHQPPPPQQNAPMPPPPMMPAAVPCGAIMDKSKLDDLMSQICSSTVLEENVKEVLVEYADDFVSALIDKACKMIKHREVKKIESRDIEFILKNVYNMPVVPRAATHIFGTQNEVIDLSKEKHIPTEAHKQRVALLKKQIRKV